MKMISGRFLLCISLLISITSCHQNGNNQEQSTSGMDSMHREEQPQSIDTFFHKIKDALASIIPGESIGKFQVGERLDSIPDLGPADHGDAGMCKSLQQWEYGNTPSHHYTFTIFSECDGQDKMRPHLKWIRTNDPSFQTKKEVQVGNTLDEIKTVYDHLLLIATYTDKDSTPMNILTAKHKGITFEMTAVAGQKQDQDSCRAIIVHASTQQVPSMYFSFYNHLALKANAPSIP